MNTHTTTRRAALAVTSALLALTVTACQWPTGTLDTPAADAATVADLTIAPEDTGAHYDRDDWPHWSYIADGCDTRDAVLQDQGDDVRQGKGCSIVAGTWVSIYDGATVTDPDDLDIDHVVPLAEVARSGTRDWTEADREHYANDPAVLIAVTAHSNRSKGDQDPADWLPERDRCGYVARWIQVKREYELTADPDEAEAIAAVLARCGGEAR